MSADLTTTDVATLQKALAANEVSSTELTQAYLDRIASDDDRLGSYLHVDP